MMLTLRDLRRLATGLIPDTPANWQARRYSRLAVLPDEAQLLQRSQLLVQFSVGTKIIGLSHICPRLDLGSGLDAAIEAFARGNSAMATAKLAEIDPVLPLTQTPQPCGRAAISWRCRRR